MSVYSCTMHKCRESVLLNVINDHIIHLRNLGARILITEPATFHRKTRSKKRPQTKNKTKQNKIKLNKTKQTKQRKERFTHYQLFSASNF